jgi:hypothetical protein
MLALTREEQVRADLELRKGDALRRYAVEAEVLTEYGRFIGGLTDWGYFVTLTHDPKRMQPHLYTRGRSDSRVKRSHGARDVALVGPQRHRKQVRAWVRYDVMSLAPGARWWSEMEATKAGQAHEHGLLAVPPSAPLLSIRQRWFERCGYAHIRPVESLQEAAEYVAKYTGKAAATEPVIAGFGLLKVASFSQVLR